jgi:hypothetical protein
VTSPGSGDAANRQLCNHWSKSENEGEYMVALSLWSWFVWTFFLIVWIAIALWPARVAKRKGHSWLLYFVFSLFFFPAALLVAYLIHDRRGPYHGQLE